MTIRTQQISEKPVSFETIIELYHYSENGWYRVSVLGFGSSEDKALTAAATNIELCQEACKFTGSQFLRRVPETSGATGD